MAFQVSPGVEVKEIDLTNVIPAVSTSIGAFAGHFSWGPVGEVKLVSSEKELINEYGVPVDTTTGGQYDNYTSFLQAASFLKYSNTLRISRACSTDAKNAGGSGHGANTTVTKINKDDDFAGTSFGAAGSKILGLSGVVHARCPGTAGNSLKLQIATPLIAPLDTSGNPKAGNFFDSGLNDKVSSPASTTAWATANVTGDPKDEVHIAVIDEDGVFTGVKNTVLEIYEGLSLYSDAVKDGGSNYYKTVINRDSKYVFINEAAFAQEFNTSNAAHAAPGNAGSTGKVFHADSLKNSIKTINAGVLTGGSAGSDLVAGTYTISTEETGVTFGSGTAQGAASFQIVIGASGSARSLTSVTLIKPGRGFPAGSSTIKVNETLLGASSGTAEFVTITVNTVDTTPLPGLFNYSLVSGVDGTSAPDASKAANVTTALDQFANPEAIDINLLFAEGDADGQTTIGTKVVGICGTDRKDCVGFISPHPTADEVGEITTDLNSYNNSYVVLDSSAVYVYNKYTDSHRYIPANGHIAGLCARTDDTNDPWFSPAGYNRGNLLGVTKLKWNPTKSDRDTLYKAGVNPIISEPGQGILLFGDKTAQKKPSAFDRINVRRLFVVLEKAISTASKFQLFELNDEFTRAMFRNMTEPFLRDVKGRRGITDFLVVCDETNNTGAVIDANRFVADIYIKPARSINFITLNFVATRTGVEFSEIVGTGN